MKRDIQECGLADVEPLDRNLWRAGVYASRLLPTPVSGIAVFVHCINKFDIRLSQVHTLAFVSIENNVSPINHGIYAVLDNAIITCILNINMFFCIISKYSADSFNDIGKSL